MFRRKQQGIGGTDLLTTKKERTPSPARKHGTKTPITASKPHNKGGSPRASATRSRASSKPEESTIESPRSVPSKGKTLKKPTSEAVINKNEELFERFEKLISRHEDLVGKHELLFQQHQELIVKHENLMNIFEAQNNRKTPPVDKNSGTPVTRWSSSPMQPQVPVHSRRATTTTSTTSTNFRRQSEKANSMPRPESSKFSSHETPRSASKSPTRTRKSITNNHTPGTSNGLRVCVRKRPPKSDETDCVECIGSQVRLHEDKVKVDLTKYESVTKFKLDGVFAENHSTTDVYEESVHYLIDNFFDGGTSTCFCFGQTASGKTFTLFGEGGGTHQQHEGSSLVEVGDSGGIYMLAAAEAFDRLKLLREREGNDNIVLQLSMFEIYGQKVRDLLADCKELAALEDGNGVLQLVGLEAHACVDIADFYAASNQGRGARATNATGANATSSRSHGALLLRLVNVATSEVLGKFSLIDLAGSERGADNDNTDKQTQMEGRQINQSLLALKEVIRAKELGRHHAPFRQSRLTQVLEESLTGSRCFTTVIGCVSPCIKDTQQTLNTLRYAESLSPNTGKRASLAGDVLPSPPLNPSRRCLELSTQQSGVQLMAGELDSPGDDSMSLI